MKRFGLFWAAMCLVAAVATACGGSDTSQQGETGTATMTASPTGAAEPTGGPAAAGAATMTIASMNFGQPVTVPPGAQIAIKNDDTAEHSVTSDTAGMFDVHVDGQQQGMLTAPMEPGEYAFHCVYHPSMHGTLVVK
jgi:plastocyanin